MFRRKAAITVCDDHIPTVLNVEQQKCIQDSEDKVCKVTPKEKDFAKELLIKLSQNKTCARQMGITKQNLCKATYIGSGAHGFTFKIGNHIMKLLIQNYYELTHEDLFVRGEIKIHEELLRTKFNSYFIGLIGYLLPKNIKKGIENEYVYYTKNRFAFSTCKIPIYEFITKDVHIAIVVQEAGVQSLKSYIENNDQRVFAQLLSQLNRLLNFYKVSNETLRGNGFFIHGDIHASNIVIMPNGSLKLIDFGLATYTKSFFMSPEELQQYVMRKHNKEQKNRALSAGLLRCLYSEQLYNLNKSTMQQYGTLNYSPLFDIFCMLVVIVKSYLILNKFISTSNTTGYYRQNDSVNNNDSQKYKVLYPSTGSVLTLGDNNIIPSQAGGNLSEQQINDDFLILDNHLNLINHSPIMKHYNLAKLIANFYRSINHGKSATMVGFQANQLAKIKKSHDKNDFFAYLRNINIYQSPENIKPQDNQCQFTELIRFIDSQLI